ncbi:MAG: hypothetical protein ACJA0Q_000654 [Saprospiraceae bacterium]|jgi:hypothetical protein
MKFVAVIFLVVLSISSFAASSLKVFSSPSTSQVNLGDLSPKVSLIVVYDHEGCLVMSSAINKSNPTLEVLNLKSGSYHLVGLDVFAEIVQQGKMVVN